MSRFKKGKTSTEIEKKSIEITLCIKEKTRLLKLAIENKEIPDSLPIENNKLTLGRAYEWTDKALGIFKFSSNTADTSKNQKFRDELKKALLSFNSAIKSGIFVKETINTPSKKKYKTRADFEDELKECQEENNEIKRLAVELYRSYAQLMHIIELEEINLTTHREALLKQSQILSKDRLNLIHE